MATFTRIKESAPPARPITQTRQRQMMRVYESIVSDVSGAGSDFVGKLTPEGKETARGVSVRIRRAAARLSVQCETWVVDGEVYFTASSAPSQGKQRAQRLQLGRA